MWHWRQTVDLFSQPTRNAPSAPPTGMSGLADEQVVSLNDGGLETQVLGALLQESQNLLVAEVLSLLVGSTRNLGHLKEVLPHGLGFGELSVQVVEITTR